MSHRYLASTCVVIAVVALPPLFAAPQSTNTMSPRTPWGDPISSGWADICCGRPIIVCCERGPSSNGKR